MVGSLSTAPGARALNPEAEQSCVQPRTPTAQNHGLNGIVKAESLKLNISISISMYIHLYIYV